MKSQVALALVVAVAPLTVFAAHGQQTGVSRPPESVEDVPVSAPAKPSAAIPEETAAPAAAPVEGTALPASQSPSPSQPEQYKPYVPLHPSVALKARAGADVDPDSGIVIDVPRNPNELPVGTLLRMRLNEEINTQATLANAPFSASLEEAVVDQGRVVFPIGSTVEGIVSEVRGGRRIRGTALIHLLALSVQLPDGTRMPLHAEVVDTDQIAETRIDSEGNIVRKDHVGATLATMSLTTGSAAAAGAVIGGGVGALVGAGIGAGVSTVVWLKQDRQTRLPKDTLLVFGLTSNMPIQPLESVTSSNTGATPVQRTMSSSAAQASLPPAAPPYKQSFVPTN